MAKERSSYPIIINAAVFILLEIAAVAMLGRSSSLQDVWIKHSSRRVQAFLWGSSERIRNHFSLQKQNDRLAEENFLLKEKLRRYEAAEGALEELSDIPDDGFRYTAAKVVKMSRNSAHNYIILNKGSEDGISPMSGIISSSGIVGIVDAVDKHFSYGLTINNSNIGISARVKGSDVTGPLFWDGLTSKGSYLKDIALHNDVNPGDTIMTSGFSTIFPPDIPVGIAGEAKIINGSSKNVKVELFQDLSSLRYVTIVKNIRREEIEALEAAENMEGRK